MANLPDIKRGNTYRFTYTHMHNGTAESLTGATVAFTIKDQESDDNPDDSSAVVRKVVTTHSTQSGATLGQTVIECLPAETLNRYDGGGLIQKGTYVFDIKIKHADGTQFTEEEGKVKVDTAPTNTIL
jgi:hypothetical protein